MIRDVQGRLVLEKSVQGVSVDLNVSDLQAGMYFYQVAFKDALVSGKFVVE